MRQIRPILSFSQVMKVIIISKDDLFVSRAFNCINNALQSQEISGELHSYSNFLELLNAPISENVLILSEENVLNDLEDLIFLKTCRNKFSSSILMHVYEKFQPALMELDVINAVNKFVKKDSNLELSINRSIKKLESILVEI